MLSYIRSLPVLTLALLLSTAACGGDDDDGDTLTEAQATQAFESMGDAVSVVTAELEADSTSGNVSVSASCSGGGDVSADGQWVTGESFALDLAFDGCAVNGITIDGAISYDAAGNETSATLSIDGRVTFSGDVSGTCNIDLTMTLSATTIHLSGSMCGISVNRDIN